MTTAAVDRRDVTVSNLLTGLISHADFRQTRHVRVVQ